MTVASTQGVVTASTQALGYALNSSLGVYGLIAVAIYGIMGAFHSGEESADAFTATLVKMTPGNLPAIDANIRAVSTRMKELDTQINETSIGDMTVALGDLLIPFHNVEGSLLDMRGEFDKLEESSAKAVKFKQETNAAFWEMANAMSPLRVAMNTSAGGFSLMSAEANRFKQQRMTLEVQGIHDRLVALATAEKIDITAPGAAEKLRELADRLAIATPGTLALRDATAQYNGVTADAKTKTDAYKAALDALIGGHLGSFNAATQATHAMSTLSEATLRGGGMFDLNTGAANRNSAELFTNRNNLSGAIEASFAHAQAVMNETNSVQAASATLGAHREQLLNVMTQLMGNRQKAEDYINTLGFTPGSVNTLVNAHTQPAQGQVQTFNQNANEAQRTVTTTVTANTGQAEGALSRLTQLQRDYLRQASQIGPGGGMGAAVGLSMSRADGGITLHQYAEGAHVAQIAPAGAMRLWAEPETGGEAYIPLAGSKRGRSTQILSQVANMFGYQLSQAGGRGSRSSGGGSGGGRGAPTVQVVVNGYVGNQEELGRVIVRQLVAAERQGQSMPWAS
jgi:hypothetical protein